MDGWIRRGICFLSDVARSSLSQSDLHQQSDVNIVNGFLLDQSHDPHNKGGGATGYLISGRTKRAANEEENFVFLLRRVCLFDICLSP